MKRKAFVRVAAVCIVLHILCPVTTQAQANYTRSTMIGIGGTNVLDTYLSAEHFSGGGLSLLTSIERHRPDSPWSQLIEHEANVSSVKDRSGSRTEIEGAYNFYYGWLFGAQMMQQRLTLQAGGVANASLGVIYNTSNSNNPAQARAHLNIMPTVVGTYKFPLFGKLMAVRYQIGLSLVGLTFSPNYGQSYYEIFSRGNYDHNIVPTTTISAPEWRQMLTLDATLSQKLTLRIGYLGNMQQQKVNNLRQHIYTHRVLIGLTTRFSIIPQAL